MKNLKHNVRRHAASAMYIIAMTVALLLFAAGGIYTLFLQGCDSKSGNASGTAGLTRSEKKELKRLIEESTAEFQKQNEEAFRKLNEAISTAGSEKFRQARKNIPGVVNEFSKIKVGTKLVWKMAKDRVCDTHDTQEAMGVVVGPAIIQPCQEGHGEILNALNTYLHTLQENDNQYRARLAQALGKHATTAEDSAARNDFLNNNILDFENKVKEMAVLQTTTALGVALELVFIRSTVKVVSRIGMKVVSKIIKTASTAGICAAADGPFPVGDVIGVVIAVGGTAWCAYDIYKMCKVLPKEMSDSLNKSVDQYEESARKEALEHAAKVLKEVRESSNKLSENLQNI